MITKNVPQSTYVLHFGPSLEPHTRRRAVVTILAFACAIVTVFFLALLLFVNYEKPTAHHFTEETKNRRVASCDETTSHSQVGSDKPPTHPGRFGQPEITRFKNAPAASVACAYPTGWPATSARGSYDETNVEVRDDRLTLWAEVRDRATCKPPAAAKELRCHFYSAVTGRREYWYGRYSFDVEIPDQVPAGGTAAHAKRVIMTWPANEDWPRAVESDFEFLDAKGQNGKAFLNYLSASTNEHSVLEAPFSLGPGRHTLTYEWTPYSFKFFVDGIELPNLSVVRASQPQRFPTTPHHWVVQVDAAGIDDNASETESVRYPALYVYEIRVEPWVWDDSPSPK